MVITPQTILEGVAVAADIVTADTNLLNAIEVANATDVNREYHRKPPCIIVFIVTEAERYAFGRLLASLVGESDPLLAPREGWTDAGYVSGPRRTVAWRVFDAKHFGMAEQPTLCLVASARTDFCPARLLFEFDGVRRDEPHDIHDASVEVVGG